jgi:hypothetical protein
MDVSILKEEQRSALCGIYKCILVDSTEYMTCMSVPLESSKLSQLNLLFSSILF